MAVLSSWLLLLLQAGSGVGVLGDASFGCPSGRYFCLPCFESGECAECIYSGCCGAAACGCFPSFAGGGRVEISTPPLLGCLFSGCDGETVAPLHPFGINFSWISPCLGVVCSIFAGESVEMSSGSDLSHPVGGCSGVRCCSWFGTVVPATVTAWRELCFWCKVCGGRWSNLCAFSRDHGRRCQVRGPRCTGMIPGRCATKKKVSSSASGLFGSQSSWTAMVFPRIQVKSGWRCNGGGLIWTELGTKRTRTSTTLVCFSFCCEVCRAFVPEQWFLPYPSELYPYMYSFVFLT
ncbi:unnamed protein product [Urochloa humidicola]